MTVLALQPRMGADEREPRRFQVIEPRALPVGHRVARSAVRPAIPVVNVVGRMTRHAIFRCAFVTIGDMTLGADQRGVGAVERESGLVVVEVRVPPGIRAVTGRAVPPQLAPVCIVTGVTGSASARRVPKSLSRRMTGGACEPGVRTSQRKVGEFVVEARRVELHDVRVAPQVIHVTGATLGSRHGWRMPVHPAMVANVRRDLLVAIEAERRLPAAVANVVAERAMLLELLVRLGEFARHEERLGIGGLNAARVQRQSQERKEQE